MADPRRLTGLAGGALAIFVVGCALIAAAVLFAGAKKTTAQGYVKAGRWHYASSLHVGACNRIAPLPAGCRLVGTIRFELVAALDGHELWLDQRFVADPPLRFRVVPDVRCRIDQFSDRNCTEHPRAPALNEFLSGTHFVSVSELQDTDGSVAFLNLVYQVEIEGIGRLSGNRKYDDKVFLGTTWRWTCDDDTEGGLHCQFVGRR
jgi:hypothetical protein